MAAAANLPAALVDAAIRPSFATLKEHGYRRRGRTFAKTDGAASGMLNFQSSQWNAGDTARFTLNLGVYVPSYARVLNRELCPPPERLEGCTWHTRIGPATGMRKDTWWEISPENGPETVSENVRNTVATVAIPWLDRCMTEDGLSQFLANGSSTSGADLLWALGRPEQAVSALSDMLESGVARYVQLANDWLAKHGLRAP